MFSSYPTSNPSSVNPSGVTLKVHSESDDFSLPPSLPFLPDPCAWKALPQMSLQLILVTFNSVLRSLLLSKAHHNAKTPALLPPLLYFPHSIYCLLSSYSVLTLCYSGSLSLQECKLHKDKALKKNFYKGLFEPKLKKTAGKQDLKCSRFLLLCSLMYSKSTRVSGNGGYSISIC